jgi:hypothetical protein
MKKARRCDSCHTHVTPRTTSWMMVQRTTRAFVVSDWSRNSASRSCMNVSYVTISHGLEMPYSLEDLFPPYVLQPRVQVLNPLRKRLHLVLVGALDLARLANGHVQREFDGAVYACA